MTTPGDELTPVLNRLRGPDLYRNNAFRITGLPTDASAARIRRAREEALLLTRLTPARSTTAAPPEGEAVRTAYEVLRDPVARLVHELLWTWPDGPEGTVTGHADAVEQHRAALEATEGSGAAPDDVWAGGLRSWATVLAGHAFWDHAKRRVADLGDPRLTTGTVRRLRDRLPRHIVAAGAEAGLRAARAAGTGAEGFVGEPRPPVPRPRSAAAAPAPAKGPRLGAPPAGKAGRTAKPRAAVPHPAPPPRPPAPPDGLGAVHRIVTLLRASPFAEDVVTDALREVARPAERTIRAACTTARDTVDANEEQGGAAGQELLERTAGPLRLVEALLGPDGTLTAALCEEVGHALNKCAVAEYHTTERTRTALMLLAHAAGLARVPRTQDLIEKNTDVIAHSANAIPTGPSDQLQPYLREMVLEGKVERVAAHLRAVAPALVDPASGKRLLAMSRDRRSVAAPVHDEPFLGSVLGCGVRPYRSAGPDPEGTLWATYAVTLFWVPVLPLAMYVINGGRVHARVPVGAGARWVRRLEFTLLLFAVVALVAGVAVAAGTVAGFVIVQLYGRAELRKARVRNWTRLVVRR